MLINPYIIPGIKRTTLTEQQLAELGSIKKMQIAEVFRIVCKYFDVDVEKAKSKSRKRELVEARQVYCYICKLYTKASLKTIAGYIGGRDHTTAIHSIQEVKNHISTERHFKQSIIELEALVESKIYGQTIKHPASNIQQQ